MKVEIGGEFLLDGKNHAVELHLANVVNPCYVQLMKKENQSLERAGRRKI
jgi:hypothetical protein